MRTSLAFAAILLLACGGPMPGPGLAGPPSPAIWPPGPGAPREPEVCDFARGPNSVGYWFDDCTTEHCLPDTRIEIFRAVNLGAVMGYSPLPAQLFVATEELPDSHCPGIKTWLVSKLSPNTYGDLAMVDPVRHCVGTQCDQVIEQGWAQSHTRYLYFAAEQHSADLSDTARKRDVHHDR